MKELMMRNFKLKIIAILLAVFAWIYVQSAPTSMFFSGFNNQELEVNLTVQYLDLHPDLELVNSTEKIDLVIKEGIRTFGANESLRAHVDLSQIELPGNYYLEIEVELPQWMKLLKQQPKYALVNVKKIEKKVNQTS